MEDHILAESYALQGYLIQPTLIDQDVNQRMLLLIKHYIQSPHHNFFLSHFTSIILKHASHIDPLQLIQLVPSTMSITLLQSYLQHTLQQTYLNNVFTSIKKNLMQKKNLQSVLEVMVKTRKMQPFMVDERTICVLCDGPIFGNAFIAIPCTSSYQQLTHIKCVKSRD